MVQSFHLPIRTNTVAATVLTAGESIFFQCIYISVKKDHANVQRKGGHFKRHQVILRLSICVSSLTGS